MKPNFTERSRYMWEILQIEATDSSQKFRIKEKDDFITHDQFLNLLGKSEDFRNFYSSLLAECPFKAFLWENKALTNQNLDDIYECALVDSPFLARQSPDSHTFSEHFSTKGAIADFANLGNDAHLIIPNPLGPHIDYTHLAAFLRSDHNRQIHHFWERIAQETEAALGDEPKWLSTSGLGVFWLHARIDSRPKYYKTEEYKTL